ncbi:MAG: CBS domain-containing protein [Methanobacteriaceae archaeon]|nr:CBS domain-containing protein [Methanobacteriaceae archaeon]
MKSRIITKVKNYTKEPLNLQMSHTNNDGDIMEIAKKEVITTPQSSTIIEVAKLMVEKGVRRLPVTDPGSGKLLGIITTMDILDFFGGGKKYNLITGKHKGNFLSAINAPIKEIMTDHVKTINSTSTIIDAAAMMLEEHVGGIPVINHNEEIVGMVTEGDVVIKLKSLIANKSVEDYMTTNIITTTPGTRIEGVTKIMVRNSLRRVPIVGEDPNGPRNNQEILQGLITASDILKYIGKNELFTKLFSNEGEDVVDIPIKESMVTDLITVTKHDKLDDICEIMEEKDIRGIPIIDSDKNLVGIITIRDLLRTVVE